MSKEFTKQAINFYQLGYWNDEQKFKQDQQPKKEVAEAFKNLTGEDLTEFSKVIEQAYTHLENNATDNLMKLDIATYCSLKKIDFSPLKNALSRFKNISEPKAENYTTYTTSENANEKLKDLHNVINTFKKYAEKHRLDTTKIVKALPTILSTTGEVVHIDPIFINGHN